MELMINLSVNDYRSTPWHLCRACRHSTHCVLSASKYQDRVADIVRDAIRSYLGQAYRNENEVCRGLQFEVDLAVSHLPCADFKQLSARVQLPEQP